MNSLFVFGLLELFSHMLFIFLSFYAMKAVRIESWIRKNHVPEARVLYVLLSIALGYTCSSFFLDFLQVSRSLSLLITN